MSLHIEECDWRPMDSAPKDGTEIELLIQHVNYQHAPNDPRWEDTVIAHWIDHNGGGWTWNGMMGTPIQWRRR